MRKAKKFGKTSVFAVTVMMAPGIASAHVDIAANGQIGQAEFKEGKTIILEAVLQGSCSTTDADNYTITYPTLAASIILPTKNNPVVKTGTLSGSTVNITGNAVFTDVFSADVPLLSTIKPFADPLWQTIQTQQAMSSLTGNKEVYNSQWLGGFVDDDKVASLKFMATLATFKPTSSCIKQARVYLPTIQYCAAGYRLASVNATSVVDDTPANLVTLAIGNAPFFTIQRDIAHLLSDCAGKDDTVFIYPFSDPILDSQLLDGKVKEWTSALAKIKLNTSGVQRAKSKWVVKSKAPTCPAGQFWHAAMGHCMAN